MKKLLLVLLIMAVGFTAQSQEIPKATYQIVSDIGYSEGLHFPDTFYISVIEFIVSRDETGFYFKSYQKTFIQKWTSNINVYSIIGSVNDSIPKVINFPITNTQISNYTLPVIFNNTIKKKIQDVYGSSNVTKLQ